jgi:hypothetical protein
MSDFAVGALLWTGTGAIRWIIWNNHATKTYQYSDEERLKFQVLHLLLFCAVGPYWLVSIIRNL